jgi:hypothetical protein
MARARRSQANMRLQAAKVDVLGYLIREFQVNPSWSRAMELLPYAHGRQSNIDNKGEQETVKLTVKIGG